MIMMLIENRYTFCVPSGSTVRFTYFHDQKFTTLDARKEFFRCALSIGRKVGVRPTEVVQGEWTVYLSYYWHVGIDNVHLFLVTNMCQEFDSEIELPSYPVSEMSGWGHHEESNEGEITMYFFHSSCEWDEWDGCSGVWSLDGTLDKEGHPIGIPRPNIEISEWEYVFYITSRYISIDLIIYTRQLRLECIKLTAGDVALLELLESRGLLPKWDGDAKVVTLTPRIQEVESTDDDIDLENEESELDGEEFGWEDENFYSADEDCENEVEQNLGLMN